MECKNANQMAWNQPGGNGDDKKNQQSHDPWKTRKSDDQGPPDLDKLLKQFLKNIKNLFGANKGGGNAGPNARPQGPNVPNMPVGFLVFIGIIVLALYLISGIYIVEPAERAVVTRFGRYVKTEGPGPHWLPRFIDSKEIVNIDRTESTRHAGLMLTKDENIVFVEVTVQYRIQDARAYLFNVVNPVNSLKQATESALRQVVGQSTLDDVLTSGRAYIAGAIKDQIVSTLALYKTGILVLDVAMQPAKAPDEVRAAFDEVIKAREEEVRSVNQAESYANDILPKARGLAERMRKEALGYKQETQLVAEGSTQRFNLILPQYQKAPKVTQTRLYLDTMTEVLSNTTKMLIDEGNSSNVFYLPIDKLLNSKNPASKEKSE
jgi:membrane protease subunit HflK